jgi:hypothetical protein
VRKEDSDHKENRQDKTYIHGIHTRPKNCTGNNESCLLVPASKGERLIIFHAGGRAGCISDTHLICKYRQKTRLSQLNGQ